ncbi:glycosyltransferase [Polyangium spumosum]|uniref:Glycosyltransferase n=1 Tax=Polyangium spumosum TaxID=889282 RepID=A0A6N7QAW2_9BACT|nr:glycosyltransferase [Polyangium spumosum]MRG98001.1 glycosyltransferase [Polyangium spumosum]
MPDKHGSLLTLSMIVKDEAATIARTLRSVKPFVDRWVILDTGSTDGTQEVVRHEMSGVPGELFEEPFVDFATTRNRALELAGTATEFVLWLDADDELENGQALRAFLEREREARGPSREAYYVRVALGIHFDSPRIVRSHAGHRFRGVVHEVLTHDERPPPSIRVPEVLIRHHRGEASAERSRRRWERDVGLLEKALAEDPADTRAAFYLAETLLWLGRYAEAEAAFARRISMGGWAEEVFESYMGIARCGVGQNLPWPRVLTRWLDAHLAAPHRAEPLHAIAMHHDARKEHALTFLYARRGYELPLPVNDRLFVDEEVYTWKMADLVASSAYFLGEFAVGEAAAQKAARARPDDERLQKNLVFYAERQRQKRPSR